MFAEYKPYSLNLKHSTLELSKPMVMGILNTTLDSFFDGGKYHTTDSALKRCEAMLEEGAGILDIGGQSSRPGADTIDEAEEIQRTLPYIEAILKRFPETVISVDTVRASVARLAVEAGASMVNDISAGDDDPLMIQTIAELGVPCIAMHKKGIPKTMQDSPHYHNVCEEVLQYLEARKQLLKSKGVQEIVIDPGFGFGKTLEHNYKLLNRLDLLHSLNCPILVGVSRKSMVWKLLNTSPEKALNGTTALHVVALLKGAHILRVHDVKEAVECVRITGFMKNC